MENRKNELAKLIETILEAKKALAKLESQINEESEEQNNIVV